MKILNLILFLELMKHLKRRKNSSVFKKNWCSIRFDIGGLYGKNNAIGHCEEQF